MRRVWGAYFNKHVLPEMAGSLHHITFRVGEDEGAIGLMPWRRSAVRGRFWELRSANIPVEEDEDEDVEEEEAAEADGVIVYNDAVVLFPTNLLRALPADAKDQTCGRRRVLVAADGDAVHEVFQSKTHRDVIEFVVTDERREDADAETQQRLQAALEEAEAAEDDEAAAAADAAWFARGQAHIQRESEWRAEAVACDFWYCLESGGARYTDVSDPSITELPLATSSLISNIGPGFVRMATVCAILLP